MYLFQPRTRSSTTTSWTGQSTSARRWASVRPCPEGFQPSTRYLLENTLSPRYTCEECVQGLEWVEAYIEDPIMIAEYVIYLEQNFCQGNFDNCFYLFLPWLLFRRLGRLQGARYPGFPRHAQHGHGEVLHPNWDLQPGKLSTKKQWSLILFFITARGLRSSPPDQAPTIRSRLFHGRRFIWTEINNLLIQTVFQLVWEHIYLNLLISSVFVFFPSSDWASST